MLVLSSLSLTYDIKEVTGVIESPRPEITEPLTLFSELLFSKNIHGYPK